MLLVVFLVWERRKGEKAILPLSLFRRRTQIGTCIESFMIFMAMIIATYYLPLQVSISRVGDEIRIDGCLAIVPSHERTHRDQGPFCHTKN